MERYDVLVVGSGPGGSSAARKCRDGGLKTLLIDKQKLPRRKACSGIIANNSQNYIYENFGPIPESVYGKPYLSRGMAFYFPSVGTIFTDVNCYQPYVWRNTFDHFLAKASGADLEDETLFVGLKEKGDEIEVTLERKKTQVQVAARYVIGADGANSHVIRSFAPEVYEGLTWASAIQKYYEGKIDADNRYLYWFLVPGMGPFPWLNLKDDQIIIGCAYLVGQKSNKFEALIEFLKKNFGLSIKSELATEGCMANTMTPMNRFFPGRGRVLMVGDAMGLMHQGGEGLSCALASGGHAGAAVIEGIKQGADAFALYKKSIRPEMVTSLDQFNPLRMKATVASDTRGQPGLFHAHSFGDELKALRDALAFVRSEFNIKGMTGSILKNSARRLLLGGYHIPAVDK
ncbi:MAG: NAD(P)/FAD-dependent oxidoreductase [Proteobacteria bacterium]|nr:NAD(P)/FAD-dependent oxidoreductase [Pseudomonadota bacterium]